MRRKKDNLPFIWPVRDSGDPEHREGLLLGLRFRTEHLRTVLAWPRLPPEVRARNERDLAALEHLLACMCEAKTDCGSAG